MKTSIFQKSSVTNMEACVSCFEPVPLGDYSRKTTLFAILLTMYTPVSTFLNISLISAMVFTRQATHSTSNLLIVCLSICDAATSAIALPLCMFTLYTAEDVGNCNLKTVNSILLGTLYPLSGYLAVLLAIDRYINMNPDIRNS